MLQEISNAVWITAIGMGLVFAAILLLWGLMAVLVRYAKDPSLSITEAQAAELLKTQAAIAAVSVALAEHESMEPHEFPLPPTALVSAWQAVMRTKILNKRGPVR